MAFYARQCTECTDSMKQCTVEYLGTDENGEAVRWPMYRCGNSACKINKARKRGQRECQYLRSRHTARWRC